MRKRSVVFTALFLEDWPARRCDVRSVTVAARYVGIVFVPVSTPPGGRDLSVAVDTCKNLKGKYGTKGQNGQL